MVIYKHDLWNLPTKITFFFSLIYLFNVLFFHRVLSYFAKPNYIVYDEWFDNDFKKTKLNVKNKKIKKISNIHEFFYEQSNYKVGGSENNLQIENDENSEEVFNNYYFENNSEKYDSLSNKKFLFIEKITKNKFKFNIKKKIIYSLSIVGFVIILGSLLFFISQSKKNESTLTNKSILLEILV